MPQCRRPGRQTFVAGLSNSHTFWNDDVTISDPGILEREPLRDSAGVHQMSATVWGQRRGRGLVSLDTTLSLVTWLLVV